MTPTGPDRLTPQALAEALSIHTPTQEPVSYTHL